MVARAPFVSSCLALCLRLPEGPGASAICRKPLWHSLPLRADNSRTSAAPKHNQLLDMPRLSTKSLHCASTAEKTRGNPPLKPAHRAAIAPWSPVRFLSRRFKSDDDDWHLWQQLYSISFADASLSCVVPLLAVRIAAIVAGRGFSDGQGSEGVVDITHWAEFGHSETVGNQLAHLRGANFWS